MYDNAVSINDTPFVGADEKLDAPAKKPAQYSSIVAYAFTINYVVGVGVLGVPYAFVKAGWLLGTIMMGITTVLTVFCFMWIIEVISRTEAVERDKAASDSMYRPRAGTINNSDSEGLVRNGDRPIFKIPRFQYEVNVLCDIFLGKWVKLFYEICIILYMGGLLWSYAAVAPTSLTSSIPMISSHCAREQDSSSFSGDCEYTYLIWMGVFAIVVLPFSLMDLTDQIIVQVSMCVLRIVAMATILITVCVAIGTRPYIPDSQQDGPPYLAEMKTIDFTAFGLIFTTAIFAQLTQHSAPGLVAPVKDKSMSWPIFMGAFLTTFVFYLVMGVVSGAYFGSGVNQLLTLNWTSYNGHFMQSGTDRSVWWADIISYFVVMFPVITSVSAYPLMSITLGNNIFVGLPAKWTDNGRSKKIKIACRLVGAVPPLILATFIRKLALIINITGLSGFFIGYIIPGIMHWAARRYCIQRWGEEGKTTPYSTHFSHPIYAWAVVVFAVLSFLFAILELIFGSKYGF